MKDERHTDEKEDALVLWTPEVLGAGKQPKKNPAEVYLVGLAETGRYTMRRRLRLVAALFLGKENAEDVKEDDKWNELTVPWHILLRHEQIIALRTLLQERGLSPASVNAVLCALRGVARESFDLDLMTGDDLRRIEGVKGLKGTRLPRGRALKYGEIEALFHACEKDEGPAGPRDAAVLALMYVGGLRRAEVAALDVGDYDAEAGELVVRGKGDRERLVHLPNGGTATALEDWLAIRGDDDGPLFLHVNRIGEVVWARTYRNKEVPARLSAQTIYNVLAKRAEAAGVREATPHDLRRTFISDLLAAGADISTVQQMAGHASVTTTARYDRRGEEAKKEAAELLHIPYKGRAVTSQRKV